METMQPVVLRGCTGGAAWAISVEEFAARADAVREMVRTAGLAGLVVYGDAGDCADLCYLSGYIPMLRWAMALVPATGEPTLFVAVPERNIDHARTLTCLDDVRPLAGFGAALATLSSEGRIGLIGSARVRASLYKRWSAAAELEQMDERLTVIATPPSSAELDLLRCAGGLTRRAADAAEQAFHAGASPTDSLGLALRLARDGGAHDVRALLSPDGGRTLHPFPGGSEPASGSLIFYLAVELDGYWGETFRSTSADVELRADLEARLDAVAARLLPGMPYAEIVAGLGQLPPEADGHKVVAGVRAIARLGLRRTDVGAEHTAELTPGVYSLRAGAVKGGVGVLMSRTVEVGIDEAAA